MSNRNLRLTKEDYGFNQTECDLFFKINTDINKGTLQLQKRGVVIEVRRILGIYVRLITVFKMG